MENETINPNPTAPEILIPKQNIILDATMFSALSACPRYLDLRFGHNLVPLSGKTNSLECGSLVHVILEFYYKSLRAGKSRTNSIADGFAAGEKYIKEGDEGLGLQNTPAENQKKPHRIGYNWVLETMNQYFEHYKNDSWIPIDVEFVKGKVIYEDDEIRIMWKAKMDVNVDTLNGIFPVDHKTSQRDDDPNDMAYQFMGQCLVNNVRTVFVNQIGFQTSLKPKEKFFRPSISYDEGRLVEFATRTVPFYAKMLLNYNEMGYFPPQQNNCKTNYGWCMYKERICSNPPHVREDELKQHFKVGKPWDVTNKEGE